jgi:hypothetical protein
MIDALVEAVESGEVPRSAVEVSGRRLDELSRAYVRPASRPELEVLRCSEHLALARRLQARVDEAGKVCDPTEAVLPDRASKPHE